MFGWANLALTWRPHRYNERELGSLANMKLLHKRKQARNKLI